MDASLKQRLVGAAVLVALAVIFLPMLVGGPEPQSEAVSVPLEIPAAPERDFETRELPLRAPGEASPAPAAMAPGPDDPNRVVTVDAPSTAPAEVAPEQDAPPAPTSSPPVAALPSAASTPVAATPAPPASAPVVAPGGRYVVNLGSYGNVANAQSLVASLKGAGLPAYGEAIVLEGKPVQRVRLGPFAQRGEAEAARLSARRLRSDLPASVVALDDAAAAQAPGAVRAPVASGFAVQLGALASEADASALRARARKAGFAAFVERASTENGVLWRVRVGPELQRVNADKLKTEIAAKLQIEGVVVSHP